MTPTAARRPLAVLAGVLLLTLLVAFLFLGSVKPQYQVVLHVLVAVGAGIALWVPTERFEGSGVTLRWTAAGLVLALAVALGMVPLPRALAVVLCPGSLAGSPEANWVTFAVDPWLVPGRLATLVLVFGFGALVATWGAGRHRRFEAEAGLTFVVGVVAVSALMHAVLGAGEMLGLITPDFVPEVFFAPFVNGHHASAVMVFGGSVALGVALNPEEEGAGRVVAVSTVVASAVIVLWDRSTGGVLAAGLVACLWLYNRGRRSRVLLIGTPIVVLAVQVWAGTAARLEVSALGRAAIWRDTLTMLPQFWLAGSGAGTFGDALRPFRTDNTFATIRHAHNDPLEWVAETGLVGLGAAVVALMLLWPGPVKEPHRAAGLRFGLIGIAAHSLVDFPFQLPAVAMLGAAAVACLGSVFGGYRQARPRLVRLCLMGVGLVQLPAAVWQARQAYVDHAVNEVQAFKTDPVRAGAGARALAAVHAVVPERALFAAWSAESSNDVDAAVLAALSVRQAFPNSPRALLEAGAVLARAGRYDEATALMQRVAERDPSDHRAWVLLARVARAQGDRRLAAQRWGEAFHRAAPGVPEAYAAFPVGLYWLGVLEHEEP
ncbi:MAG: tetratricopeptide repeat protein, partial [Myxococcales bacterium]|nr:tetratricopeptide repeat protein [Myxococcales bacterium]